MQPRPAPRVLVVDDEPHNRDLLEQELDDLGVDAVCAGDGPGALARLAAEPFDLVLLDVMMPGIDGIETLRRIKADPQLRYLPVVMISAIDDIAHVCACLELGAEDYLPKPFNPTLLAARVRGSLEKKRWRDQEAAYVARIEAERERADRMLAALLPASAIAELGRTGGVTPRRHEGVAVLFADIVGFTAYSEAHPPETVVADLDALMRTAEGILARGGLEKIKSIGDGVAATANLLLLHEDPVMAAVRCGRALIAAAEGGAAGWRLRVGISYGTVVSGVVGGVKFGFDVWGDTVNVASRLSGIGVDSGIYLTAEAFERIAGRCEGEAVEGVTIKGKEGLRVVRCGAES